MKIDNERTAVRSGLRNFACIARQGRLLSSSARSRSTAARVGLARGIPDSPSRPQHTAGDVVESYIAEQQRVVLAGDLALRRDNDSVIHKTRVATRRLRSTLRTFRPYFDPARAQALDAELRWYAALLGDVRDRQVLQRRLDAIVCGRSGRSRARRSLSSERSRQPCTPHCPAAHE